jgi:hypothetical protein
VETPIFFIKVIQREDDGSGKPGQNMGVCKEYFFIYPPAPEKLNYLSAQQVTVYDAMRM